MGRGGRSLSPPLALSFSLCLPTIDDEEQRRRTLTLASSLFLSRLLFLSLPLYHSVFFSVFLSLSSPPSVSLSLSLSPYTIARRNSLVRRWFLLTAAAVRRRRRKDTGVHTASLIQCRGAVAAATAFSNDGRSAALRHDAGDASRASAGRRYSCFARYRRAHSSAQLGLIWFSLVWFGLVWFGLARRDATRTEATPARPMTTPTMMMVAIE